MTCTVVLVIYLRMIKYPGRDQPVLKIPRDFQEIRLVDHILH